MRPRGEELTEPPLGFSVNYYNRDGLRGYKVDLTLHDKRTPEQIKDILYLAYLTICREIQPRGPLGDLAVMPPTDLKQARIDRAVKQVIAAEAADREPDPPEAA